MVHDNILENSNENLVVDDNILEKLSENLVLHDNILERLNEARSYMATYLKC